MALADKLTLVPSAQYGVVYGRFVQGVGGPSLVSGVDEDPDAALSPVPGLRITFKPSTDLMISDPATQDSFAPTAYSAYTDGDGFFEISLFATDVQNSSVENWYWETEVYSQNPGNRAFRVGATTTLKGLEVKANSAVWLGDIITSQEASGDYVVQGKSAYKFAVEGGYEGTEDEFAVALNASLDFPGVTTTMLNDGLASKAGVDHIHPRLTLTGNGFPGGVVPAEPGTLYFDTDRTCGSALWFKEWGTGGAGWRLLHGDTGWRKVDPLPESYTSGECHIRRVNDRVTLRFVRFLVAEEFTTSLAIFGGSDNRIPPGFGGWGSTRQFEFIGASTNATVPQAVVLWSGRFLNWVQGTAIYPPGGLMGEMSWDAADTWPGVLPGTPV